MTDKPRLPLLCVHVCTDGLKCGADWPKCTDPIRCVEEKGCFWRRWHEIPTDKMSQDKAEALNNFREQVETGQDPMITNREGRLLLEELNKRART